MKCATEKFGIEHIAVFYELNVAHPDLPGVGAVGGNLDYTLARVDGNKDLRKSKLVLATQPYMTVIQAKRTTALNTSAIAQLIAQVLTVDYTEQSSSLYAFHMVLLIEYRGSRSPRVGVLTDGHTWTFYYFVPNDGGMDSGGDLYESEEITAANKTSIEQILGDFGICE